MNSSYKYLVVYDCKECNSNGAGRDLGFMLKSEIKENICNPCPVCENENVLVLNKESTLKIYNLSI